MAQQQVKSKQRVADFGEVNTAEREVNAMLDLVKPETERIDSRFLEPACGDGNFCAEILRRKLAVCKRKYGKLPEDYGRESMMAVGSIYGVDILADNAAACRERLYSIWENEYTAVCKRRRETPSEDICQSVCFMLSRNIICGNALTMMEVDELGKDTSQPIVFSQWSQLRNPITGLWMFKREDSRFDDTLREAQEQIEPDKIPIKEQPKQQNDEPEQMTFGDFASLSPDKDDVSRPVREYPPIYYREVWKYGD